MEKKNTILLTVIAVATLLVAVVGATFAYFSAQGGDAAQADVIVKTGTSSSASLGTFSAISIYADQTNFIQGGEDQSGTSTGTVSWTAPGSTPTYNPTAEERTMCYNVVLNVTKNDFEYTTTEETPELIFRAEKDSVAIIDDMDITKTTTDVQIPTVKDGRDFKHVLTAEAGLTQSNNWKLTVTLKNLATDQQKNTGKTFTGAVKFTKVDCQ